MYSDLASNSARKPHHKKRGFKNVSRDLLPSFWKFFASGLKYKTAHHGEYVPKTVEPDIQYLQSNSEVDTATWIGHATFLLQIGGKNIITDPMFSGRAFNLQWVGPKRKCPPALYVPQLPQIDYVVVSHDHYDHLDKRSIQLLLEYHPNAYYLVPLGLKKWLSHQGVERIIERDWWEDFVSADKVTFTAVPAQHFSGRTLFSNNKRLWAGWVIEYCGKKVYFAGDTGYDQNHFDAIGSVFSSIDLACIPIGAYCPESVINDIHINPEQAVKVHKRINSKLSVAMHWGTIPMSFEDMDEPPKRLRAALAAAGIEQDTFQVLAIGETVTY